jgi:hypothetical protein
MRYPYDLFVKFLITRKADVNGTLSSLGLPELTDNELLTKNILAGPLPPSVKAFIDSPENQVEKKEGFLEWAEAHEIRELWEIQPEFLHSEYRTLTRGSGSMKKACDLFAAPNKRTAMSLLLMREFPQEDIIDVFSDHFETEVNAEVIQLARKYFFDFREMTPTDWHSLFHNLPPEERDKLQVGREPHSRQFVEYSIGKVPNLTYEEILNDIMVTSYYKFKELANQPLMDTMAQRWAAMAMTAGEKKIKFTKGDRRDLNEDIQMRFEFTEPTFPTLAELSTGSKE